MKKIILFASVLAAVAVQAATVNWTVSKQTDLKNMSYAVITPAIVSALQGGASPYDSEAALNAAITAGQAYNAAGLASALTADGTVNGKGTVASRTIDNVGDSFTVIFWDGAPTENGKFYYGTFSTSGMTYEKPNVSPGDVAVTSAALTQGTFTAATFTQSGGQDPIPEPTTVALLALGLAAVGLKRKVA